MMGGGASVLLLMILLTVLVDDTLSVDSTKVMSDLLETRLGSANYNSRIRPDADQSILNVYINVRVADISSISEVDMEYSMAVYFRQTWLDNRLAFTEFNRSIALNYNQLDRIWIPDLFVRNLKSGLAHTITVPNRMLRLSPDGTIFYTQRLSLTLSCTMNLERYPMDNQTCYIELGSYGYTTDDIMFLWRKDALPVEIDDGINLPEYNLDNITSLVCAANNGNGAKPCLRAYFHLSRRLRSYILSTYLPQFLVVLLSWLSFWIDPESAPARTSLSILTVLTITTQSSGLMRSMPSGAITKAIDVWMATCLVFVFGAFIEYAIVNTLVRKDKEAKFMRMALDDCNSVESQSDEKKSGNPIRNYFDRFRGIQSITVERACRIMFPFTFLVFNLVYWPYYYLL